MIWVIGDIHGMLDPLDRIITEIRLIEDETREPVEKLIFLGDYIDHGPSSKGVLDLVRKPPWPAVALMGNHEDLAVRTCLREPEFIKNYRDTWSDNCSSETIASLAGLPGPKDRAAKRPARARPEKAGGRAGEPDKAGKPEKPGKAGSDIPDEYLDFLRNLPYFHQETLEVLGRSVRFVFTHSLPNSRLPLDEQLVADYDGFNGRLPALRRAIEGERERSGVSDLYYLEGSLLWNRYYDYGAGYGGAVIVHGHTPTVQYKECYHRDYHFGNLWPQFEAFPRGELTPFLFSRTEKAKLERMDQAGQAGHGGHGVPWAADGDFVYQTRGDLGVEAINLDTGAVAAGALTALGLSPRLLPEGLAPFLTCRTGGNLRLTNPKALRRTVRVDRLGGPEGAPGKENPS